MSVAGAYRSHAAALRRLVMEALREEDAGYPEVRRRIRRYLSREGVGEDLAEELAEEAEQQFRWIDRRRMGPADRRRAAEVLEGAGEGFARMEGATGERLKKVVLRAIQEDDATLGEIENRVARALSSGRHQAFTVANTARAGFDRAATFRSAEKIREGAPEEELHFKFTGPPPERPFCKKHIGRVYTEAEIRRLSNGQGLPVRSYMGGYNCRHQWVLASDDEAERRMTDAELRPRMAALGNSGGSGGGAGAAGGGRRGGSGRGGGRDSAGGDDLPAGRRRFEELTASDEYFDAEEHGYYSEEQDGFVAVREGHQLEGIDGEMRTARIFADRGVHVELLDETGQGPSADARHGGPRGDGLDWDYKLASAQGGTKGQAQRAVVGGSRPSGNVLIRFEEQEVNVDLLNRGVKAGLLHDRDREKPLAENIVVLYATPEGIFEERRTPEEFFDGRLFQGPS